MPPLEEQFPLVNPLVLQRPDALQPPDPEEEEVRTIENRDETPRPGTLGDGIDRVTLSANARQVAPVQPTVETFPATIELESNTEGETTDGEIGAGLQDFANGIEENRIERNPAEPLTTPAAPPVPNTEREPRVDANPRIENRFAAELVTDAERNANATPRNERLTSPAPLARSLLSDELANGNVRQQDVALENPLGLRGNIPEPPETRLNILTPAGVGEDPPGPNIGEARNFGQGRTLSLDLESVGNEDAIISVNTVEEALEEDGAIPGPDAPPPAAELMIPPAAPLEPEPFPSATEPEAETIELRPVVPDRPDFIPEPRPVIERDPEASQGVTSFLNNTREVFEADQATEEIQTPAFPELDPDEPFIPVPEAREEDVPLVAQEPPLNLPSPEFENVIPVAAPLPGNVDTLDENPQALRPDNLGTAPALRSNRALRNFLQEFNNRIETPEAVTESEGGPIIEVQNNAPPPPAVFENLEAVRVELLNDLREQETGEGVTRPEEDRAAPPPPRTTDTLLTERGQNIDQFI